jgi:hypothetical protein
VVQEPFWFLGVTWHGETLCGLGVWSIGVLLILGGFFSAKCGSSVSARFLIYGAHTFCFLPLVAIFDPLHNGIFREINLHVNQCVVELC